MPVSCAGWSMDAGAPLVKPAPPSADCIEYSVGSCREFCPAYTFAISRDGHAAFQGLAHTAVDGVVTVGASPAAFILTEAALARSHPPATERTVGSQSCRRFAPDQQVVTVVWWSGGKEDQKLVFDLGCLGPDFEVVRSGLVAARKLMPIDSLVGRATEF